MLKKLKRQKNMIIVNNVVMTDKIRQNFIDTEGFES